MGSLNSSAVFLCCGVRWIKLRLLARRAAAETPTEPCGGMNPGKLARSMAVLLCFRVPGNESQPGSCCTVDSEPQKLPFPPSFQPPPPPPPTLPRLIQPQHANCLRPLLPSAHQPGVNGCFLFHVRVIPTGPRPNESFPPRYGEKITLRVRSECSPWHKDQIARLLSRTLWRRRGLHTHTVEDAPR